MHLHAFDSRPCQEVDGGGVALYSAALIASSGPMTAATLPKMGLVAFRGKVQIGTLP